mgnify:CR=1 FL=1
MAVSGNGGKGSRGSQALLETPARRRFVRARSRGRREPPAEPPPVAAAPRPWSWLRAALAGLILSCLLFGLLGYIQPVFKKNERIEIPKAVQVLFRAAQKSEKPKAVAKKEAQRPEPRAERREARPKAQPRRESAPKQVAAKPRSEMQALKDIGPINVFQGLGGSAGAGGVLVSFAPEDAEVRQELAEHAEYMRRRERIREGASSGRAGGPQGGGRAGAGGGMQVSLKSAEGVYQPIPKYPPDAERRQVEGWVKVRVLVGITGGVEKVEIVGAHPSGVFEETVRDTLGRWKYAPAVDERGRPLEFWDEFVLQFRLEDAAI